jgi:hypothetical protein
VGCPSRAAPQHLIPPKQPECGRFSPGSSPRSQIPEPRKHGPHYFGAYSDRARALRKKQGLELQKASPRQNPSQTGDPVPDSKQCAALRKRWANLIRRVFRTDPLLCPCAGKFRILADGLVRRGGLIEIWLGGSRGRELRSKCSMIFRIVLGSLRHDRKTIRRPHLFTDSSGRPRSLNDTHTVFRQRKASLLPPSACPTRLIFPILGTVIELCAIN